MTPKVDGSELDAKVLAVLKSQQVATTKYIAALVGSNRQKVIWHLRRLTAQNLAHLVMTTPGVNRSHIWAAGTSTSLTKKEVLELAIGQIEDLRTRLSELTGPSAQFKTTWVGGINPWTKEEQK